MWRTIFALALLAAVPALADDKGDAMRRDWAAFNTMAGHFQQSLWDYAESVASAEVRADALEARLKWVLDNWVPKPAKK
jgi:hypothetical protein